jgi:septum formation protein
MGKSEQTLLLASASPRRQDLMRQVGLRFEVRPSDVDESATGLPEDPAEQARALALMKAEAVAASAEEGLVIGADTVVVLDAHILGKPADDADALRMLGMLQGRTHQVITGLAVLEIRDGAVVDRDVTHVSTAVTMRAASPDELRAYIATGEPHDKAGAYAIQGYGAAFVEGIVGDYFNVVGLPLFTLCRILKKHGLAIPAPPGC